MLVIAVALFLVVLLAAGVVTIAASQAKETAEMPWAQKVRAKVPALPVIHEDEDAHLRR